ncbi:MAG: hypothetical protein KBS81_08415, partial [Spirochaetales bacterium]|nr:hypothetical protein [Candidatus Physcosoma equi]
MMKRILLFLALLFSSTLLFAATPTVEETGRNFHLSTSLLMTNVGVGFERGQDEWDLSFSTLFPNTFFMSAFQGKGFDEEGERIRYGWKLLWEDVSQSLNLLYALRGEYRHDVWKSETYDLDLGVGLECGASFVFEDAILCGALLNTSIRLSHNYGNGGSLFSNFEIPLGGVVVGKDNSGVWTAPVL